MLIGTLLQQLIVSCIHRRCRSTWWVWWGQDSHKQAGYPKRREELGGTRTQLGNDLRSAGTSLQHLLEVFHSSPRRRRQRRQQRQHNTKARVLSGPVRLQQGLPAAVHTTRGVLPTLRAATPEDAHGRAISSGLPHHHHQRGLAADPVQQRNRPSAISQPGGVWDNTKTPQTNHQE